MGDHQKNLILQQQLHLIFELHWGEGDQSQIQLSLNEQLFQCHAVFLPNLHLDIGIALAEAAQGRGKQITTTEGADAKIHPAGLQIFHVLDHLLSLVIFTQYFLCPLDHQFSCLGGAHSGGGAGEELAAQLVLHQPQSLTEAGLGHKQSLGGLGDALCLGNGKEIVQISKFHRSSFLGSHRFFRWELLNYSRFRNNRCSIY